MSDVDVPVVSEVPDRIQQVSKPVLFPRHGLWVEWNKSKTLSNDKKICFFLFFFFFFLP